MGMLKCIISAAFLALICWWMPAFSQSQFAEFPFGENSSTSADGSFTLQTKGCQPNSINCDRKLWLADNRAVRQKLLIEIQRTVRIGWAPSGSAFFLNDDFASNESSAYLYFPAEDRHFDVGALLDQKFPQDRHFEDDSHHYINGVRWIDTDKILVKRSGHFDRSVAGGNEFSVCYEVSKSGEAKRLFETHQERTSCRVP
jgi:hypothetical protein